MSDVHVLLSFQQISRPVLDWLFLAFSFLGDEVFYLMALSWIFWCVDRQTGIRLGVVLFLSFFVNFLIKEGFQLPRPDHPSLRILDHPEGFSFPSGHAQSAATFWLFLALRTRKSWLVGAALLTVAGVSVSRLYLGVHFPRDVLTGAALGAGFALFFLAWYAWIDRKTWKLSFPHLMIGSIVIGLVLFALSPDPLSLRVTGSLGGALVGYTLCSRFLSFRNPKNFWQMIARFVPGIISVFLLHMGSRFLMGQSGFLLWLRYWIVNWWVVFGVPVIYTTIESRMGETSGKEE